ncbi:MAG: pyridoxamine 5'-phosphate oxidase family protein, partial [bacterium]|nr:pyridoxamine 5'-phosphate oxidase family protein [bacterium]
MEHIKQAKEILKKIKYACMATVNKDGTPHNSPLVFLYENNLEYIFWGSHPESQHSQNVLRTGQVFFVAFDSVNGSAGVYIQAIEGQIVEG